MGWSALSSGQVSSGFISGGSPKCEAAGSPVGLKPPTSSTQQALVLSAGAILGGLAGAWALQRVNEKVLRIAIVCIGVALTVGLFLKPV